MFKIINSSNKKFILTHWNLFINGLYQTKDDIIEPTESFTFDYPSWQIFSYEYYEIGYTHENCNFVLYQTYYYKHEITNESNLVIINIFDK